MSHDEPVAREIVVSGRVQGVFFRAACTEQADRLGVSGWVANRPDGTVAAHFEGPPDAVRAIIDWCRHGPRMAVVSTVDVRTGELTGATRFVVR